MIKQNSRGTVCDPTGILLLDVSVKTSVSFGKRINVVDIYREKPERKRKFFVFELIIGGESRTARLRTDPVMSEVEIHNGFLHRNEIVVMACCGELSGREMRAVERDTAAFR